MRTVREVTEEVKENFPKEHLFMYLVRECGFKRVAEIGVASGTLTNRVLVNADVKKYYAIDPWKVYIESYDRPPHAKERRQSWWDGIYERVVALSGKFPAIEIYRMTSVEAGRHFISNGIDKLDAVYIDSIHDEENIVYDVASWMPVIRDGGVICGHDFTKRYERMARALKRIFEDDLNLMIHNPNLSIYSYKNTNQGGNWWVELDKQKEPVYYERMTEHFQDHIRSMNKEYGLI